MMNPILTAQHAADLNKLVQTRIDPRLFLLCNYEPTVRHVIGEDGRYLLNIQDLYKFAIDSGCVSKLYYKFVPDSRRQQFTHLQRLLDQISAFRTVFDHNISQQDGYLSAAHLDSYNNWVHSVINKTDPETTDDFKLLNQKLADMASELVRKLEELVCFVAQDQDRSGVIRSWIDLTLYWYSNNTKTDIYKGHLINAYLANAKAAGRDKPYMYRPWVAGAKVKRWIEEAVFFPVQKQIDDITGEISSIQDLLSGKVPRFESMRQKMKPAQFALMENNFRTSLQEKQTELTRLNQEMAALQEKAGSDVTAYFYRNLEYQLRETMDILEKKGIRYTLLPQDLIQEDIVRIFDQVPSPDGDF